MNKDKAHKKRKEIFSNPLVQYRIMGTFVFLTFIFVLTNFFISRQLLSEIYNRIMELPLSPENSSDIVIIMQQQGTTALIQMGFFIFLAVFVLLMAGVILSHRVGGPIYQLNKYIDELVQGKVKPRNISFRKNDFFHELASNFNKLQKKYGILKESNDKEMTKHEIPTRKG